MQPNAFLSPLFINPSYISFPRALKEEPYNKDLQPCHCHHHNRLQDTEIEDAALGASDGGEVSVLPRAEILLVSVDGGQLRGELEDGIFEHRGLFRRGSLFCWELGALLVLDLGGRWLARWKERRLYSAQS
jgi:hypothetical protein